MTIETVEQLYQSQAVALSLREILRPASGEVIFPPTFAIPRGYQPVNPDEKSIYDISTTKNGNVCILDSIGSQANRMEPIFMEEEYRHLVPQVTVKAGEHLVANLLKMGHRLADAAIRFSDLQDSIKAAFLAYRDQGNATSIAKIGPTSLVFGVWDSRETHTKVPRLINATIRAYDVDQLTRSAQYSATFRYLDLGFKATDQKKASKIGLDHAVKTNTHGGIIVRGNIVRQAELNLNALRALRGADAVETATLQRYILGLALLAMLAPRIHDLRQGCLLVSDPVNPAILCAVTPDGGTEEVRFSFDATREFAKVAAETFGVGESQNGIFNRDAAKSALNKTEKEKED